MNERPPLVPEKKFLELQSINEELTKVNRELKIKIKQLSQSNDDFHNLTAATDIGTILLDRALQIKFYTPPALKVFNITAADIGRPLAHTTHRLDYENLADDALEVMKTLRAVEREAQTDDGNWYIVRLVPYRATEERIDGVALTFVNFTERKNVEVELAAANRQIKLQAKTFETTLSGITDFAYIFDRAGRLIFANRPLLDYWGISREDAFGKNFYELNYPDDLAAKLERQVQEVIETKQSVKGEGSYTSPTELNGYFEYILNPVLADDGTVESVAGSTHDITELKQHEQEQQQLLRKLVTTQEDERRRISRELHDQFGQNLTALQINLESLRKVNTLDDNVREKIEQTQKIAVRLDAKVDFMVSELRLAVLDDLGLAAALDNYTNEWSAHSGVPVKFHTAGLEETRLSPDVEINLYRIAQEALNNVTKYAAAARVNVILERRDGYLSMIIEDNGSGFNLKAKTRDKRKGLGIIGMRERVAFVGGTMEIESKIKRGTTVFVRVPL
ncbi:MAG: PAS domain-containing protein [Acidobacteriota bacterium]|nr:PAS domain-containing protein [Acidobacteriota bacterium]